MAEAVQLLRSTVLFDSDRFGFWREHFATPDGEVERICMHHPGAVAIIARPGPDQLVLVRQYRYPLRRWTLEIPAGTRCAGEAAAATAARELTEETGLIAGRLIERCRFFPATGVSDEEMVLFEADDLRPGRSRPDHGELVEPVVVDRAGISSHLADGSLADAKTLIALALLGWWPESPP